MVFDCMHIQVYKYSSRLIIYLDCFPWHLLHASFFLFTILSQLQITNMKLKTKNHCIGRTLNLGLSNVSGVLLMNL